MIPQTRAATAVAAEAAVFAAEAVRKERNPVAAGSCSSRNKSSGTLKAPWAQTMAIPTMRAEIRTDPTLVRKTTTTLDTISIPRVSLSEKVRPRMTRGGSEGRKR